MSQIQDPFPKIVPNTPLYLRIKAVPRQPKTGFLSIMDDGTIKIRLKAIPESGRANAELVRFLADHYKLKPASIEILSGAGDRVKLVRITGAT
ncbi:MAG: DUF167 domain-containing protein [Patescibacteria group bacterium]